MFTRFSQKYILMIFDELGKDATTRDTIEWATIYAKEIALVEHFDFNHELPLQVMWGPL